MLGEDSPCPRRGMDALVGLGDEQLAALAGAGDRQAFEVLFERFRLTVYRVCARVCSDPAVAEDLVQDTFLKVWQAMRSGARPTVFRPWICRIAHNTALDQRKRAARVATIELPAELPGPLDTASLATLSLRLRVLIEDIRALSARQRQALVLRELQGLAFSQIGQLLGIDSNAAKRAAEAGRKNLELIAAGRERRCEDLRELLSTPRRGRWPAWVRAHARACPACARLLREHIHGHAA
jgi:RNA polymerase sigma factor (sigma-70 family)